MKEIQNSHYYKIKKSLINEKEIDDKCLFYFIISLSTMSTVERDNFEKDIFKKSYNLGNLLTLSKKDWKSFPYNNTSFFVLLSLIYEMVVRFNRSALLEGDILKEKQYLLDYLVTQMAREPIEQFRIIFLNSKNELICDEIQGKGTINHTPVYPREVARRCLELKASSIIMVHNHPSGQESPSEGDVIMTQKVEAALKIFNIHVADHFIITRAAQISFRALGLLS